MFIKKGSYIEVQHARRGKKLVQATSDFNTDKEAFWPVTLALGFSKGASNLGGGDILAGMKFPCRGTLVQSFEVVDY